MAIQLTFEEAVALTTATAELVMTGRYCTLTAWVLLLWDHAVHLDKEIELFWYKPWSVAKALYFFNRYNALVFLGIHSMIFLSPNVSDGLCLGWFKFEGYTGTIGIASVELILGFRVLALWNSNKWIVGIVGFAVFAEITTMLSILSSAYVHMQAISQPDPSIPYKACIPLNVPPYFFAFWLPPLGYEFLVFSLAAIKGFHTLRYSFAWGKGEFTFRSTGSRLLEVMIRDSLWYFLTIFGCDLFCSLIWLKGPDSLLQAVVGWGLVIPSVAGSHLLLNLRDAYYHPSRSGMGITTANSTGWTTSAGVNTYKGSDTFGRNTFGGGGGKKQRTPTFGRSKDVLASGGRHRVGQLDTQWALDPEHDDITVHADAEESKLELAPIGEGHRHCGEEGARQEDHYRGEDGNGDRDGETPPTGSQRSRGGGGGRTASTIMTTATISTLDDTTLPAHHPHPLSSSTGEPRHPDGGLDAYVYSTRQLVIGGGGGGGYDLEAGKRSAATVTASSSAQQQQPRRPIIGSGSGNGDGDGESYELHHVRSNGSVV